MKKMAIGKGVGAVLMSLTLAVAFVPALGVAQNQTAQAATNANATKAINNLKTKQYYKPGGSCPSGKNVGWLINGSWNCSNECYAFARGVSLSLCGSSTSFISGVMSYGYKATNTGSYNCVGTITDSPKANPSYNSVVTLMKKSYPGDVIQFKGGYSCYSGKAQHTAIVEAVNDNGITIYQHGNKPHVNSTYYSWNNFYNSYLNFNGWTTYTKGISLYHYKNYAQKFGNSPAPNPAPSNNKMTLSGATYPTTLQKGKPYPVKGTITSPSKITYVSAAVYSTSGKWETGGSTNPNSYSYNLAGLDNKVIYNNLGAGTHVYKVYAKNSSGQVCLLSKQFTVTSGYKAPYASGANAPTSIKCGKFFGLKGVVYGNGSNLQQVTAAVYTPNGTWKTGRTINVNTGSVDIAKSLDPYVVFNHLPRGTYYYKVIAKNAAGTYTLVNKQFKVY